MPQFYRKYGEGREFRIDIHHWAIWWNFWTDNNGWSSSTPRYRKGSFHIGNFLLGKALYSDRLLDEYDIEVPMYERSYRAKAKLMEVTWKRSRWFARIFNRVQIDMLDGEQIPVPGKGENSWDCGEDATYAFSCMADSVEDGIASLVRSILVQRRKYGGRNWRHIEAK